MSNQENSNKPKSYILPANYTPLNLDDDEIMVKFYDSPDCLHIFTVESLEWLEKDLSSKYWIVAPP